MSKEKEEIMKHIVADHDYTLDFITLKFECHTCEFKSRIFRKEKKENE